MPGLADIGMIHSISLEVGGLMRGGDERSGELFSYIDLEARVRRDHPLRAIREIANVALEALSADFAALYSRMGRPSTAPERLLRAMLLQALYSIRSERQLMERLEYDLLFRWFVGLGMDDAVWDHSTFSKNRDRLLAGEIAGRFLGAVLEQPKVKRLLSSEHFAVDGTLIEAWASLKSFKPREPGTPPPDGGDGGTGGGDSGRNATVDFKGQHLARNTSGRRSAIDRRTTRHPGYAVSQRIRKRIEEAFGWIKTVAGLRKTRFRGRERVDWAFTFAAAAYNLVRLPKLLAEAPP